MQYQKLKSVGKLCLPEGEKLTNAKLGTLELIKNIVGGTLGPGGKPVIIERYEFDLPPLVTKDGVTVFKALGLEDPIGQVILEAARDAAIKTANEAGDGTTSATILAEAFVREIHNFCKKNAKYSPQKVIRELYEDLELAVLPFIEKETYYPGIANYEDPNDLATAVYRGVARVSANGDSDLANAVMKCFELVGDFGNVTIAEASGPSRYEVEAIDGYFIGSGYDSAGQYMSKFINDSARQMSVVNKPKFLLYNGRINQVDGLATALRLIGEDFENKYNGQPHEWEDHNVVVVATGFSEQVYATLAAGFQSPLAINVFPLALPLLPMSGGQLQILEDLSAITGAFIFDPINHPLDKVTPYDLGPGVDSFEANRFRSNVIGYGKSEGYEERIAEQAQIIRQLADNSESEMDRIWQNERVAKLTHGIARLTVRGSSNVEIRERKDRAEDAICAVRGAMKHGVLRGGASILHFLSQEAQNLCKNLSSKEIFSKALYQPFHMLLSNSGLTLEEIHEVSSKYMKQDTSEVYDAMQHQFVDPLKTGLFDSKQAVTEAVKNSLSIASVIGTLGGTVVFNRDKNLERDEAGSQLKHYKEIKDA